MDDFAGLVVVVVALKRLETGMLLHSVVQIDRIHLVGEVGDRISNNAVASDWTYARAIIKLANLGRLDIRQIRSKLL